MHLFSSERPSREYRYDACELALSGSCANFQMHRYFVAFT